MAKLIWKDSSIWFEPDDGPEERVIDTDGHFTSAAAGYYGEAMAIAWRAWKRCVRQPPGGFVYRKGRLEVLIQNKAVTPKLKKELQGLREWARLQQVIQDEEKEMEEILVKLERA